MAKFLALSALCNKRNEESKKSLFFSVVIPGTEGIAFLFVLCGFLEQECGTEACFVPLKGCPGIAVPPGSAHIPHRGISLLICFMFIFRSSCPEKKERKDGTFGKSARSLSSRFTGEDSPPSIEEEPPSIRRGKEVRKLTYTQRCSRHNVRFTPQLFVSRLTATNMHWQHVAVANHIRPQVGSPDAASLLGSLELRSSVVSVLLSCNTWDGRHRLPLCIMRIFRTRVWY